MGIPISQQLLGMLFIWYFSLFEKRKKEFHNMNYIMINVIFKRFKNLFKKCDRFHDSLFTTQQPKFT